MNFFDLHGVFFLICIAIFPRLTLLFSSVISGGLLWWVGFIFFPHLLVAILSIPFWDTNPVLVILALLFAMEGSRFETTTVTTRMRRRSE